MIYEWTYSFENIQKIVIFWFRRDLRLFDNHGLYKALTSGFPVLPVFIFDENIISELPANDARISFIYQELTTIHNDLRQYDSSLYIFKGKPVEVFDYLTDKLIIHAVYANHDYEPYAIKRDHEIQTLLKNKGISFFTFKDQVIFEKEEIIKPNGKPYTVFTPYAKKWKEKFFEQNVHCYPSENFLHNFYQSNLHFYPALEKLGFIISTTDFPSKKINEDIIKNYHKSRNIPSIDGTSKLSVHLRFGTISIRKLVKIASELNETYLHELIWREFFMMILFHFPQVVNNSFKPAYDRVKWLNNENDFEKWCKGETGYPIVDAGMRELNETGFMHNRVRMIVASFLTKHLLIDWRWGETYFAQKLLDYELSSNVGNWQWAAGSGCDAVPYFRIFNPYEQTKRYDPGLLYVRKWIRDSDYNKIRPIVEHNFARKRALDTFRMYLKETKSV